MDTTEILLEAPDAPRHRHDGWTFERRRAFIEVLAEQGSVTHACAAVGMSPSSAYRLRGRPGMSGFDAAWHAATRLCMEKLADSAMARAINGVTNPVVHNGEVVAHRTRFDERLTIYLLNSRGQPDITEFGTRERQDNGITEAACDLHRAMVMMSTEKTPQGYELHELSPTTKAKPRRRGRVADGAGPA